MTAHLKVAPSAVRNASTKIFARSWFGVFVFVRGERAIMHGTPRFPNLGFQWAELPGWIDALATVQCQLDHEAATPRRQAAHTFQGEGPAGSYRPALAR